MRETLLIAWREYKQYVFSRGFILLILLAPVGLFGLALLFGILQNSIPQRHYIIIDETGNRYDTQIEHYLDKLETVRALQAWDQFVILNETTQLGQESRIPAPFAPSNISAKRLDAFKQAGGITAAKQISKPFLRVDPENFTVPKTRFIKRYLSPELAQATPDQRIEILRPLLTGETFLPSTREHKDVPLFAALILPKGFGNGPDIAAQYWSRNLVDIELKDDLSAALNRVIRLEQASQKGLTQPDYEAIVTTRANLNEFRPDRETIDAELNIKDRVETALPAMMTYFLFILIFSVGHLLLTNTIEERSNKIVEMLLSSVSANQLMLGKLIGIGAVGLTIPAIAAMFAIVGMMTIFADNQIASEIVSELLFSPLMWVYLFYFLCGYIIFAMMYLAIGAISNSLQDAQTFLGPISLLVMAPLPLMVLVFQDPNGLLATIMTWIPFYTPYAVMLRAASDPPLWEIISATVFMLFFGGFFIALMGRIFRRGLLNSSPTNLKTLFKLAGREPK